MDDMLKLYKVVFQPSFRLINDDCYYQIRFVFARTQDEAWTKFASYAEQKKCKPPINVRVKELSEEEMKQIEILVPFYKECKP